MAGATFHIADNDDVETIFRYVIGRYATEVEPLQPATCACYSYRANVNNQTKLSNHSSATAFDLNWGDHPNNTPTRATFTGAQVDAVHAIYDSIPELSEVMHWGGDWVAPLVTDSMHHELHDHDLAKLRRVADRIREDGDMTPEQAAQLDRIEKRLDDIDKVLKRITKSKREVIAAVEAQDGEH